MIKLKDLDDQFSFLQYRIDQEAGHLFSDDPLSALLTIEINTTELCNRTCVFCPRHDPSVFPNRNLHMTPAGAEQIAKNIGKDYRGKISFSGFGENLLNPYFADIIEKFAVDVPDALIECNTNGDKLDAGLVEILFGSGLDKLYINLYDGAHQIEEFEKIMSDQDPDSYKYRMHWSQKEHGLILNNRGGAIEWLGIEDSSVSKLQGKPCHYPFYKMFVDWNGDVLFCSNDWQREHVVANIMQQDLKSVWLSPVWRKLRRKLIKGNRTQSPCNKCSVDGTLFGKKSFKVLKKYESRNNR